jgi:hypothetical protein
LLIPVQDVRQSKIRNGLQQFQPGIPLIRLTNIGSMELQRDREFITAALNKFDLIHRAQNANSGGGYDAQQNINDYDEKADVAADYEENVANKRVRGGILLPNSQSQNRYNNHHADSGNDFYSQQQSNVDNAQENDGINPSAAAAAAAAGLRRYRQPIDPDA